MYWLVVFVLSCPGDNVDKRGVKRKRLYIAFVEEINVIANRALTMGFFA
jgi:hypothetical protein